MYKKLLFTLNLFLIGLISNAQEVKQLSLEQAIEYALEHNPSVVNAKLAEQMSDGKVSETIATGMPQINGGIDISNNFELPTSFLPGEIVGMPGEEVPVQFGTRYSGSATLSLSQMIFDGSFFVGLEGAKTYKELSTKELVKTKIDIAEMVAKSYYAVLVSEFRLELIEKNFGRLDTLLNETTEMYNSGFAEKIDVSRSKVQFNNISVQKINAEKSLQITRANLSYQLGLAVTEPLGLTDELSAAMFEDSADGVFSYTDRIEYSILQTNQELAFLDKKLNNVRYMPSLDLYATVGANLGTGVTANIFDITNEWYNFGLVGIRMKIPVFDGLQKHYVNQQKKLRIIQIENSFDQMERRMDLQVRDSKVKLDNAIAILKSQQENMDISQEVYEVTKEKYQAGVGSNLEVINADADYKEAQTNFFVALYNALIAKVDYKKSIGKLL